MSRTEETWCIETANQYFNYFSIPSFFFLFVYILLIVGQVACAKIEDIAL